MSLKSLKELSSLNNMSEKDYSNMLISEGVTAFEVELQKKTGKEIIKALKQDIKLFKEKDIATWPNSLNYDVFMKVKIFAKEYKITMVKLSNLLLAHRLYQISFNIQ